MQSPRNFFQRHWKTFILIFSVLVLVGKIFLLYQLPNFQHSYDTVVYSAAARSLAAAPLNPDFYYTWQDVIQLKPPTSWYAEFTAPLMVWAFLLPIEPQIAQYLSNTIFSLALPLVIAGIVWELFHSRRAAALTVCLATFHPFIWTSGFLTFDSLPGLFFICLSIYLILHQRQWYKLTALIAIWLAFYQYAAYKLVLAPLIIAWSIFAWHRDKKSSPRPLIYVGLGTILLTLFFASVQIYGEGQAFDRIIYEEVLFNPNLKQSAANFFVTMGKNYLDFWQNLGTRVTDFFQLHQGGSGLDIFFTTLYPLDVLLFLIGAVSLWKKKRSLLFLLLICSFLIAPLPIIFKSANWASFRPATLTPFLIIFVAVGLEKCWQKSPWLGRSFFVAYLLGCGIFLHAMINKMPLHYISYLQFGQEIGPNQVHNIILGEYINRSLEENHTQIKIYNHNWTTLDYFYLITPQKKLINHADENDNLSLISQTLPNAHDLNQNQTTSVVTTLDQNFSATNSSALTLNLPGNYVRGSFQYQIYNDSLCQAYQLQSFNLQATALTPDKANFRTLSNQEFCEAWLVHALAP